MPAETNSNSDSQRNSDSDKPLLDKNAPNLRNSTNSKNYLFPKYIYYILGNEFCERYSYYGLRAVLVLFVIKFLGFSNEFAVDVYHLFIVAASIMSIFGGILADGYLGKYKTILYLSFVYLLGVCLLSLSAINFNIRVQAEVTDLDEKTGTAKTLTDTNMIKSTNALLCFLGLFIISVGTGGIKPCVSSFGADQFHPNDEKNKSLFFSYFYWIINLGSTLSSFFSPFLRTFNCGNILGDGNSCYFLSYFIPCILMLISILLFLFGRKYYVKSQPSGNNILWKCLQTIYYGAIYKIPAESPVQNHWLYGAYGKVENWIIRDTKYLVKVLIMFLPLPIFWASFDQKGSKWILQAVNLNGNLFDGGLYIVPDQVVLLNPFFVLSLVPIFSLIYKFFNQKFGKNTVTTLRKISIGLALTAVSYVFSAMLQEKIDETSTFINQKPEIMTLKVLNMDSAMDHFGLSAGEKQNPMYLDYQENKNLENLLNKPDDDIQYNLKNLEPISSGGKIHTLAIFSPNHTIVYEEFKMKDENGKSNLILLSDAKVKFRFLPADNWDTLTADFDVTNFVAGNYKFNSDQQICLKNGAYSLFVLGLETGKKLTFNPKVEIGTSGAYTITYLKEINQLKITTDINPSTLSILWIVPQFFMITVSEIMVSISGLEFAYNQSPKSLKSVVTSFWLFTHCAGNIFVVLFNHFISKDEIAKSFY